ncbi:MAG: hypothetical protein ACOX6H_01190 [Christensenellales bacterium]
MRFLLENTIFDLLSQEGVVIGMVLAAIGFAASLMAKRITRVVRGTAKIAPTDPVLLFTKGFGLVCILVALLVMIMSLN